MSLRLKGQSIHQILPKLIVRQHPLHDSVTFAAIKRLESGHEYFRCCLACAHQGMNLAHLQPNFKELFRLPESLATFGRARLQPSLFPGEAPLERRPTGITFSVHCSLVSLMIGVPATARLIRRVGVNLKFARAVVVDEKFAPHDVVGNDGAAEIGA
jgi:hypothetical protein